MNLLKSKFTLMNKLLSKKDFLLPLLILVVVTHISFVSKAQNTVSVSGSVYELRDPPLPLPGAGITISGKTQGTSANVDGKFSLANVPLNSSIVISMVGYKSQTYIVRAAQPNLIFSLERN